MGLKYRHGHSDSAACERRLAYAAVGPPSLHHSTGAPRAALAMPPSGNLLFRALCSSIRGLRTMPMEYEAVADFRNPATAFRKRNVSWKGAQTPASLC